MSKPRVVIIDALNMYFRAYNVNPSLSTNGQPIGGLKGSLGILQKLIREVNPDQTILCWDGAGGSQRRKKMNKNYKAGRKPIRLNRAVRNLTENEEVTNKILDDLVKVSDPKWMNIKADFNPRGNVHTVIKACHGRRNNLDITI